MTSAEVSPDALPEGAPAPERARTSRLPVFHVFVEFYRRSRCGDGKAIPPEPAPGQGWPNGAAS